MTRVRSAAYRHAHRTCRLNSADKKKRVARLLTRDGNRCYWCNDEFSHDNPPTLDHLVGRTSGGTDAMTNLVLACGPKGRDCNNKRANEPGWKPPYDIFAAVS